MIKIISGGQTGVDVAALYAARLVGFPTGGYIPKGFRTNEGPDTALALYGLKELATTSYRERTRANVQEADGTLVIALKWSSLGIRCTLRAIEDFDKRNHEVHLDKSIIINYQKQDFQTAPRVIAIEEWIRKNKFETLNVAGNSEQTAPGIQDFAVNMLIGLFANLKVERS